MDIQLSTLAVEDIIILCAIFFACVLGLGHGITMGKGSK